MSMSSVSLSSFDTNIVTDKISEAKKPSASTGPASGFIMQLFHMVNEAPPEVVSWTPNGDSFIIGSDISRFENEILPAYFRHSRFTSLVRQLNFYTFRKINRERTVWIYQHPLFRKNRPQDLVKIRRRAYNAGIDGRKKRIVRISAGSLRPSSPTNVADLVAEEQSVLFPSEAASFSSNHSTTSDHSRPTPPASLFEGPIMDSQESMIDDYTCDEIAVMISPDEAHQPKDQSEVVTDVANKLARFVRNHAFESSRTLRRGIVTPTGSFTHNGAALSSGSLLTYDDEFEGGSLAMTDQYYNTPFKSKITPRRERVLTELKVPNGLMHRIVDQVAQIDSTGPCLAQFFLQPCPNDIQEVSNRIHFLFQENKSLRQEFMRYRAALHSRALPLCSKWYKVEGCHRNEMLQNFATFAANRLQAAVVKMLLTDRETLKLSMENWLNSIHLLL